MADARPREHPALTRGPPAPAAIRPAERSERASGRGTGVQHDCERTPALTVGATAQRRARRASASRAARPAPPRCRTAQADAGQPAGEVVDPSPMAGTSSALSRWAPCLWSSSAVETPALRSHVPAGAGRRPSREGDAHLSGRDQLLLNAETPVRRCRRDVHPTARTPRGSAPSSPAEVLARRVNALQRWGSEHHHGQRRQHDRVRLDSLADEREPAGIAHHGRHARGRRDTGWRACRPPQPPSSVTPSG
jgi:hypothetical protein